MQKKSSIFMQREANKYLYNGFLTMGYAWLYVMALNKGLCMALNKKL
jgi:hypothetical protein